MRRLAAILAALSLGPAAAADAAPALVEVGRFQTPVAVVSPPGDLRLFVVEQPGRIRIVDAGGTILAAPFLDVTEEVVTSYEQGLLNVAFAPDYASSGRFYVYLTARGTAQIQVREYQRSAADPNRADPAGRIVLRQDHASAPNHNGGGLTFGPDGKLWASLGDGGGGDNSAEIVNGVPSAQSPATFLGKLVRLDPLAGAPEIVHSGLRNAWRFSFDRQTGDLVIGDVGQGEREEIDVALRSDNWLAGANWGWPCWEGTRRNTNARPAPCDPPDDRFPAHQLLHDDGAVSITGGVVVRDPGLPTLNGRYLYADFGFDRLRSLALTGATASGDRPEPTLAASQVSSIWEDACGRVVLSATGGSVFRVVDGSPSPCAPETPPGGTPTSTPPPATAPTTCALALSAPRLRSAAAVLRHGLRLVLRVRAACSIRLDGTLRGAPLRARSVKLVAGEARAARVRLGARARRTLMRRASRGRRATAMLRVSAQAASGPAQVSRARVPIRP